ncbi:MAG: hypothetical protein J6M05_00640 [Cardiobacteriaceae bacterium]|nr:hypothetical protein [Cardiobacteriaceae bacterium]
MQSRIRSRPRRVARRGTRPPPRAAGGGFVLQLNTKTALVGSNKERPSWHATDRVGRAVNY